MEFPSGISRVRTTRFSINDQKNKLDARSPATKFEPSFEISHPNGAGPDKLIVTGSPNNFTSRWGSSILTSGAIDPEPVGS